MEDLRLAYLLGDLRSARGRVVSDTAGRVIGWPKVIAKLLVFVSLSTIALTTVSAEPCKMPEGKQEYMHDLADPTLTIFVGEVAHVAYFEDDARRTCRRIRYELDYVVAGTASNPITLEECGIPYSLADLPKVDRLAADWTGFQIDARVVVGATMEGVTGPYPTIFRFNCDYVFHSPLRRGILDAVYQLLEEHGIAQSPVHPGRPR